METVQMQPLDGPETTPDETIPQFTVVVKVGGNELDDPAFLDGKTGSFAFTANDTDDRLADLLYRVFFVAIEAL